MPTTIEQSDSAQLEEFIKQQASLAGYRDTQCLADALCWEPKRVTSALNALCTANGLEGICPLRDTMKIALLFPRIKTPHQPIRPVISATTKRHKSRITHGTATTGEIPTQNQRPARTRKHNHVERTSMEARFQKLKRLIIEAAKAGTADKLGKTQLCKGAGGDINIIFTRFAHSMGIIEQNPQLEHMLTIQKVLSEDNTQVDAKFLSQIPWYSRSALGRVAIKGNAISLAPQSATWPQHFSLCGQNNAIEFQEQPAEPGRTHMFRIEIPANHQGNILSVLEKQLITLAMAHNGYNSTLTAKQLGMCWGKLSKKLDAYNIPRKAGQAPSPNVVDEIQH